MPGTKTASRTTRSKSTKKTVKASTSAKSGGPTTRKKKSQARKARAAGRSTASSKPAPAKRPTVDASEAVNGPRRPSEQPGEQDVIAAISKLGAQIAAARATLDELTVAHGDHGQSAVRTLPADRAAATFQRLVTEAVDDRFGQMLPPLIALRHELAQHAAEGGSPNDDLCKHGVETLNHVLSLAKVDAYEVRVGEPYDPLIHFAVDETHRPNLPEGVVAEPLQPGFRTARGKVLVPAKVKVNRS